MEKARFYFNKAMEYKKHKYKSEIDIKAKTALEILKNAEDTRQNK